MSWVRVASADELDDDLPLAVEVETPEEDLDVAIVRHGGRLFAIEDECSHGNVPLSEGDVEDGTIECYLHGSVFDLATGEAKSLPATQPVRVFPVRIEGDEIQVDPTTTVNESQ
ncbi:non-heme iron oxygenase ferredoxin subunit [uncultured Tessaracoccus sp.]|uniref:non-heme iron oxygenase ferredoxin subunit n=1 Tax=uncultured Tessaracoccus sp. TaxID=905023 RepID=UPI0025D4350C|nr:non-heme iron oxygenase ferredoxin subunit [uncultured Tessaracoccus sp.]